MLEIITVCVLTFICVVNTVLIIDLYGRLGELQTQRINRGLERRSR